jgi:gluconate 2-dehydrogenase gamma chain
MKRRDSLKALTLTGLGISALNPQEALAEQREIASAFAEEAPIKIPNGRQKEEAIRDAKLMKEKFFTPQELATITVLSDIIIPADAKSGSASQSGVPQFIEFIAKDMPGHQLPLRGGLAWLNAESRKRFGKVFTGLTKTQQIEIVEDIAYPQDFKPEMSQGVSFFTLMRNLTATGFYTSKIGFQDLGYVGNTPNIWEGVPADVKEQYKDYIL